VSFDQSVLVELRKRLGKLRVDSVEVLAVGRCADHSEYRYSCGYIKAIDDANILIDEILSDAQKG
jgi:hypothetical protein